MRTLAVIPTRDTVAEVIRSWEPRPLPDDQLSFLALTGQGIERVLGYDLHHLDVDLAASRFRRPLLVRGLGHLPQLLPPFRDRILKDLWPDLLSNIRSFDPDLVDLRWLPGREAVRRMLVDHSPFAVITEGAVPPADSVDASWRRYDPNLTASIVLPVFNGDRYLQQAIESCLQQTHSNLEVLVVDDGSTDGTAEIIAEQAARDPRIISIQNDHNLGLPRALNVGFARARGEFLTWTSHDNYYESNAIEVLVQYLCTWQDVDLVYTAIRIINESGNVAPTIKYRPRPWRLPFWNPVGPCFLFRKEVYLTVGDYRTEMEYAEDYDYWVRVAESFRMRRLHLPLYYYRRHGRSMTARGMENQREATRRVRQEHFGRHQG